MNSRLWRWCHLDYFQRHEDHHKLPCGCQPRACSWGRFSAIQLGGWSTSGEADWEPGKQGEKNRRAKDLWFLALSLIVWPDSVARKHSSTFTTLHHFILWFGSAFQVIASPHFCKHDHAWLCFISYFYIHIFSVCSSQEKKNYIKPKSHFLEPSFDSCREWGCLCFLLLELVDYKDREQYVSWEEPLKRFLL